MIFYPFTYQVFNTIVDYLINNIGITSFSTSSILDSIPIEFDMSGIVMVKTCIILCRSDIVIFRLLFCITRYTSLEKFKMKASKV